MRELLESLIESEQKTAREMVRVLWGVDLDDIRHCHAMKEELDRITFPVLQEGTGKAYWYSEGDGDPREGPLYLGNYRGPRFDFELVELDRWIVPWKVKAGYNAAINMLAFRLEAS